MINDILTKLHGEFRQKISSERQVVYVMVQIRKAIEGSEDFDVLKFHCDWVMHPKLDRRSAKELLDKLNSRYADVHRANGAPEAMKKLGQELGLEALHVEFHKFLKQYGLDDSFCDAEWWLAFLSYYLRVIQDCPLEGEAQAGWSFDIVVLVDPDLTAGTDRLHMQWEFSLKGQPVGVWLVSYDLASLTKALSTNTMPAETG